MKRYKQRPGVKVTRVGMLESVADMVECEDGEWVGHTDAMAALDTWKQAHAEVKKQRDACCEEAWNLDKTCQALRDTIRYQTERASGMQDKIVELTKANENLQRQLQEPPAKEYASLIDEFLHDPMVTFMELPGLNSFSCWLKSKGKLR